VPVLNSGIAKPFRVIAIYS